MNTELLYQQLTNVDIELQKELWDERGKGYYGEYLLFCELYKSIPGNCKILMNLNIPTRNLKTTEIDLLLIHETGLYVFEIKHYKGTIYGNEADDYWTQYFRTVKNNKFLNPIKQNDYHIQALKYLFPETPIHSCIVFTNHNCDIRITNSSNFIDISKLKDISKTLQMRFANKNAVYSLDDINALFEKLSVYSQMKEPISINETEANFFSWVQPTISKLEEGKAEIEILKSTWLSNTNKLKKAKQIGVLFNLLIAIICVIASVFVCVFTIQKNNLELAKFKQNFLRVDEIDNEYIDALNSYVNISNISLLPFTEDAVSFTARISMTNDIYGIALTENSKYIVTTNSGQVFEYAVFGQHLNYSRIANCVGKGMREYGDLSKAQFYGISNTNDISYIKITNVELMRLNPTKYVIKSNLELELYSN